MISKSTSVAPAAGEAILWRKFLNEITCNDPELENYLQILVGYLLTGSIKEQMLPFLNGKGSNGKSVFVNIVQALMGEYSRAAPQGLLSETKFEAHTTDIAGLRGHRMVTVTEIPHNGWNESRLKQLTGGDTISARMMPAPTNS